MPLADFTVQQIARRRAVVLPDALAPEWELVILGVLYGLVLIRMA